MRKLFCVTLLFLPLHLAGAERQATDLQRKLDAHVAEYSLSAIGLADALARTSKQFQLPMGIEWMKDKQALGSLSRSWMDETVGGILRSIVETYPGYSFEVKDGIVHVFRQDLLNDSRNFLNLKVPVFFEVRHEPVGFANVQLRSVMQNIVSPRNLPPGTGEAGSYTSGNVREKPLTLSLRGLTVREALEKMAAVSEHNVWIVTFSDTSELTPTGFRRTETLWHPAPFPITQQPMWDFFAWREYGLEYDRPQNDDLRPLAGVAH